MNEITYEFLVDITDDDLEGHPLLSANNICVDIETQTESELKAEYKNKFGVSYVADILVVSFDRGAGYPTVIVPFFEGEDASPEYEKRKEFVRRVFHPRPDLTIIGHNVIFDLRSLGGHFGFNFLSRGADRPKIWDTMVMSMLLLMAQGGADTSLGMLVREFHLLPSIEDEVFYLRMKDQRVDTLGANANDLMRYVAMDSQTTYRLYALQKAVVQTQNDPTVEPKIVFDEDGLWHIETPQVTDSPNRFSSTKNYKALAGLVEWEQRKLWAAACMTITGMRLNTPYVLQERQRMTDELVEILQGFRDILDGLGGPLDERTLALMPYAVWLDARNPETGKVSDPKKWHYSLEWRERYYGTGDEPTPQPQAKAAEFLYRDFGVEPIINLSDVPLGFRLEQWIFSRMTDEWNTPEKEYTAKWKAQITADWYRKYLKFTKPQDIMKLVGSDAFQMWYVFVYRGIPVPEADEIFNNMFLATPKLIASMEHAQQAQDWRRKAMDTASLSLSGDAMTYYFGVDPDTYTPNDPLMLITHNQTQISRINEFIRHAARDGRIHSVVAPKAVTSRATHTGPNIGNLQMSSVRGFFIADDGMVQASSDLSNAENWSLAMTSGDNNLAEACASQDFHWEMMKAYIYTNADGTLKDEFLAMMEEVERGTPKGREYHDFLRQQRKVLKAVTFGSAYGAGAAKVAMMLRKTKEEAQAILDSKARRFQAADGWKHRLMENVEKLWYKGFNPPFVLLWTGRRVPVPVYGTGEGQVKIQSYKGINYVQQGAVAEIVWRAMVLSLEEALDSNMSFRLINQVHDEIVFQCEPDEFWKCSAIVIKHLHEAVPPEYLNRTIPACRFLAAVGPENKKKWGYNPGVEYPIDTSLYIDYWGVHDMPEGESEAPTNPGDMATGYSVTGEIEQRLIEKVVSSTGEITLDDGNSWTRLAEIDNRFREAIERLDPYRMPISLQIGERKVGPLLLPERMALYAVLAERGHDMGNAYWTMLDIYGEAVDAARDLVKWWVANSPVATPEERRLAEQRASTAEQEQVFNNYY